MVDQMIIDKSAMTEQLTSRQKQVVHLLVQYKSSKEIALIIGISSHTVDNHIDSVRRKFGFTNRKEIARAFNREISVGQRLTYENLPIGEKSIKLDNSTRSNPEDLLIEASVSQCVESVSDLLGTNISGLGLRSRRNRSRLKIVCGILLILGLLVVGLVPFFLHI